MSIYYFSYIIIEQKSVNISMPINCSLPSKYYKLPPRLQPENNINQNVKAKASKTRNISIHLPIVNKS